MVAVLAVTFGTVCADEELPVLVRSFVAAKEGATVQDFEDGKFVPRKGETIAFLGGTDTFSQQRYPELEILLQRAWPELRLKIRNLGWQGDTVFHQARPRFFYTKSGDPLPGSSPDTRERTEAGIIVIGFGKSESLESNDPQGFLIAYQELIEQLVVHTHSSRIVLQTPTPFFEIGPAASLADRRNQVLRRYCEGIRLIGEKLGLPVVDCFRAMIVKENAGYSDNGIHLNEAGHRAVAEQCAKQLGFPIVGDEDELLRQAILRRNRLWQQYYHPTNWAFLFGDRQHVPASRDHIDTNKRWFVEELNSLPKLIAEAEEDIHRYAGGKGGEGK